MSNDFSSFTGRLNEVINSATTKTLNGAEPHPLAESRAHAQSLLAQVRALEVGDYGPVLQDAHQDIELDIFAPPQFPWIRRACGLDEYRQAVQQNFSSVEDQRAEISSITTDDEHIVVIGRERGRIRESGAPYDVQFVQRFRFREGKLAKLLIIGANSA